MDNRDNLGNINEGFDEISSADDSTKRADQPIEDLFKGDGEEVRGNEEASAIETEASEVSEASSKASEAPQETADHAVGEEPPVASFTPEINYGYVPNGSYHNNSGDAPQTHNIYVGRPPKQKAPREAKQAKPKKGISAAGLVAIILAVAIIGAGSGFGGALLAFKKSDVSGNSSVNSGGTVPNNGGSTITINDSALQNVVEAVYEKASPSVVGIRTTVGTRSFFFGKSESSGEGTGVIYSSDGYIITCYHVIENIYSDSISSSKVEVFLPGDPDTGIEASVVGYSKATDIALLKIEKTGLTAAEFGTSSDLKVGQYAVAIGNPGGLQFMSSVSYGVISGLNRTVSIEGLGEMSLIQTDAAINPGNSGGALVNTTGKVIAINSSKYVSESYEGMGFAIPIDTVIKIIQNIFDNKDDPQPYVGIEYYTNVTENWLKENNLPAGIIIKDVVSNGPAEKAGLKAGDIIVEFNGVEVSSVEAYTTALSKCRPGQKVSIKIYRGSTYYTGTLTIGSNNAA